MVVSDVLTARPSTIGPQIGIRSAMHRLIELDVRHLPVVDDGDLVGIISDEVVDLMIEHRIGALPVVSPGTQELVGIVSCVDVLRAARDSL